MRILIIDDEEYVRLVLEEALRKEGCEVVSVAHGQLGLDQLLTSVFDCVISDLRMPGIDGRAVLRWVRKHQPDVDVMLLTGHGDVKDAVEAIKEGAWDFLVKDTPFNGNIIQGAIIKLVTVRALRRENIAARLGGFTHTHEVVPGKSLVWQKLMTQVLQIAPAETPVVIQGETGSGKEIIARTLHAQSRRSTAPFLAINCGAISQELLESELFGHEKGAFTGAATTKRGLIAAAENGTLFLDEVGEMPGPMQIGLLRFLDQGEYRPVGSTRTRQANVRIVAATNSDLQELVRQGRFREDLLYRINTVTLRVPPLRERQEDIPKLAEYILSTVHKAGDTQRTLTPDAMQALTDYSWPGNVRELRNVIEGIVLMNPEKGPINSKEIFSVLPSTQRGMQPNDQADLSLHAIERLHILQVLTASNGNKTHAAKTLKIDYKTLLAKLRKYGVAI